MHLYIFRVYNKWVILEPEQFMKQTFRIVFEDLKQIVVLKVLFGQNMNTKSILLENGYHLLCQKYDYYYIYLNIYFTQCLIAMNI